MFLSLLATAQKKMFMSMAFIMASSDGVLSENERLVIESYSTEMNMEVKMEEADKEFAHVLSEINTYCEIREKKIIVFELIGLAMVDGNYDEGERKLVRSAIENWGLNDEFGDFCEKKLNEYLKLQEELTAAILS